MENKSKLRTLKRTCVVCGKKFSFKIDNKGHYDNGHYFTDLKIPIEGTGKWKKVGTTKILGKKHDVVDWTGKEETVEYWECNECFEEASHRCWLEEEIEKLFGKRCKDYNTSCVCCQAWSVYDVIKNESHKNLDINPKTNKVLI